MCINNLYNSEKTALDTLFDNLNLAFFESTLSKPVITIQHDRKGQALGWFTPWEAWQSGESKSVEINMSANFLDRDPFDKAATLLHEMCHLYAYQNKIKDHTRGGTYHNKQFKQIAEAHGLEVKQSKKHGYAHTILTIETREKINKFIDGLQLLKRLEPIKKGAKSSSTRKYICPECGQSVRATKVINIICGECDCRMIED